MAEAKGTADELDAIMRDLDTTRGWPDTDDPNAPCLACGHPLISHRPPLYECVASNRLGDRWHACHCERFLLE